MNPRISTPLLSAGLPGVLLAPDDGTGTGGGAAGTPPPAGTGDGGTGTEGSSGGTDGTTGSTPPTPPSFTAEQQTAINAEVARQLGSAVAPKVTAAKAQWEKDLHAMADAENQTAEEKANARAVAAEQAAKDRIDASNTRLIAADAKVAALAAGTNPARVDALLRVADLTAVTVADDGTVDPATVRAAVDRALVEFPEFKTTGRPAASGTEHSEQTITAEQFAAMGYSERVKLRAENPELYAKLAA